MIYAQNANGSCSSGEIFLSLLEDLQECFVCSLRLDQPRRVWPMQEDVMDGFDITKQDAIFEHLKAEGMKSLS